jgi:iron(III) transport system substrate-binding protein
MAFDGTSALSTTRRRLIAGLGAIPLVKATSAFGQSQNRVVVYSTTHPAIQTKLATTFKNRTGIEVQSLRLNSSAMAQRFLTEQKAKQYLCDVVTLGSDVFFKAISQEGLLRDLSTRNVVSSLKADWRPGRHFVMITAAPAGIAYHKQSVSGASIPKGWKDLLRPEFKGQMILTDPRMNENLVPFLVILQQAYGDDFLRELGRQDLKLVPVTQQGIEQLAAGEAKIVFPCNPGNLTRYEGQDAPIKLVDDVYPTQWTPFYSGIPTNAPNQAAAEQWFDYVLSDEGQKILCDRVSVSPIGNIPGALPQPSGKIENPDTAESLKMAPKLFDLLGLPA